MIWNKFLILHGLLGQSHPLLIHTPASTIIFTLWYPLYASKPDLSLQLQIHSTRPFKNEIFPILSSVSLYSWKCLPYSVISLWMAQEPKSLNISMSPLTSELIPLNIDVDLYLQNNSLFSPFSAHLSLPYPGVGIFCTVTISHNGLPCVVLLKSSPFWCCTGHLKYTPGQA